MLQQTPSSLLQYCTISALSTAAHPMTAVVLRKAIIDMYYSVTPQYQWQVLVNMVLNPLNFLNVGLIIKVNSGSWDQSVS